MYLKYQGDFYLFKESGWFAWKFFKPQVTQAEEIVEIAPLDGNGKLLQSTKNGHGSNKKKVIVELPCESTAVVYSGSPPLYEDSFH